MSDQNIIITDPAAWRAGDKVTIEGTLTEMASGKGAPILVVGRRGPVVRSSGGGIPYSISDDETITVTVRRPAPSLPDKPGDVFYATVDDTPNVQVAVIAVPDRFVCVFPSGGYGTRARNSIDASTVRRVRLVPEDEQ